jgi:hypothetical protein
LCKVPSNDMPKQSLELNQLKHWKFSKSSIDSSKSQMDFQLQHDLYSWLD